MTHAFVAESVSRNYIYIAFLRFYKFPTDYQLIPPRQHLHLHQKQFWIKIGAEKSTRYSRGHMFTYITTSRVLFIINVISSSIHITGGRMDGRTGHTHIHTPTPAQRERVREKKPTSSSQL